MIDWQPVRSALRLGQDARIFPGGVVEVGRSGGPLWRDATGRLTYEANAPAVAADTVYDLASLTKVLATAAVAMRLVDRGRLDLAAPVRTWVPDWSASDRRDVTVRDLLEHASGLPAWLPLYRTCRGLDAYVLELSRTPFEYAPRTRSVYSDLGFILLGAVLERAAGTGLAEAAGRVWADVGPDVAAGLAFLPPGGWLPRVAPVRIEDERGHLAPGVVDDANAWALGGVAGHAGMFGTASAVGAFARVVLTAMTGGSGAVLAARDTMLRFVSRGTVPGSSRALGWDTMVRSSSCGTRMSDHAFGHTGFTGTSLWIDPAHDLYVVLLANRVHPHAGDPEGIRAVRRALHDAVADVLQF